MTDTNFRRAVIALFLAIAIFGFLRLDTKSFWASHAESRRAEIAANMLKSGDYIVPTLNGKKIFTKPPLYYWAVAKSYIINGEVSERAARMPSALFGILTAALMFLIGSRLYDTTAGLFSAAVLSTAYYYAFYMRFAELDMMFTFFIALSFYCMIPLIEEESPSPKWSVLFWVSAALAFMVKGPFALLFPLASYLALTPFNERRWTESLKRIFPPAGIILFFVIAAPWFIYVFAFDDAAVVFREEALERVGSSRGHDHSLFFYLFSLVNFSPWALFLPFALVYAVRYDFEKSAFAVSWFGAGLLMASIISAKNHHYILPLYPGAALITGRYLSASFSGELKDRKVLDKAAVWLGLFVLALLVFIFVSLPFSPAYSREVPEINPVFIYGLAPLSIALLAGAMLDRPRMWLYVFTGLFVTYTFAYTVVVPALNTRHSHKSFVIAAKPLIPKEAEARMYKLENFQVSFYLGRPAPVILSPEKLAEFGEKMARSGRKYYIITRLRDSAEAVEVTGGRIVLEDPDFVAVSESNEGKRFILIEKTFNQTGR